MNWTFWLLRLWLRLGYDWLRLVNTISGSVQDRRFVFLWTFQKKLSSDMGVGGSANEAQLCKSPCAILGVFCSFLVAQQLFRCAWLVPARLRFAWVCLCGVLSSVSMNARSLHLACPVRSVELYAQRERCTSPAANRLYQWSPSQLNFPNLLLLPKKKGGLR